jgi:alpha-galactosidase
LDKDYVHVVTKALAAKYGVTPVIMVKNVADFERAHVGYDIAGKFVDAAAFKADLVILCIGENVAALKTPDAQARYQEQVTALLKTLKSKPQAAIIVRSSFWANEAKDTAMRKACEAIGGTFVDISTLSKDEQNYARSERPYKHAGVANHPGDRGMAAIAEAIVKAVK